LFSDTFLTATETCESALVQQFLNFLFD